MKKVIHLTLLICAFLLPFQLKSQVTIGSGIVPNKGALLDLKENENEDAAQGGKTANRGMMLPRVNLPFLNKLQPMYSYDAENIPSSDDLVAHTGLTVYNTNKCEPFGRGVYVWDGSQWIGINAMSPILSPSLTLEIDTLHIPSGMDARLSKEQILTFEWKGSAPTFSSPQPQLSGSISGGLIFTVPRGWSPSLGTWIYSPSELSVWADDMTNSVISSNPWATRQSKITLKVPANDCGPALPDKDLLLNQTNYAIIAGSINAPVKQVILNNTTAAHIEILSNVPWQATVTADADWNVNDILQKYTTALTDQTSSDGTTGTNYSLTYQGAKASPEKRYSTAKLILQDPAERARDYVINVMQCQGSPKMNNVYMEASTNNTSNGSSAWAGKVVRHPEKSGVYKEFYSAEFGDAGRWMISNLAAQAYDGITHSEGRTLTRAVNSSNENNKAYWAYPNRDGNLLSSSDYDGNPFLGYLYTWDAATGGKGGDNGEKNVDRYNHWLNGWSEDRSEVGMQEWTGARDDSSRGAKQMRRQGICPKGWHLPSDYEWTQLELEIIKNTSKYADMTNITNAGDVKQYPTISGPDGSVKDNVVTSPIYADAWRGSTHGQAMKDICELNHTGKSKHPELNGFAAMLAGYGLSGQADGYGNDVMFWTSSVAHSKGAYARILNSGKDGVHFYKPWRFHQFSVRCKKD